MKQLSSNDYVNSEMLKATYARLFSPKLKFMFIV